MKAFNSARSGVVVGAVILTVVAGGAIALAVSSQPIFVEPSDEASMVETEITGHVGSPPALSLSHSESSSLQSLRSEGRPVFAADWFSEGVPVPVDAIAAAEELRTAIGSESVLRELRLLAAEEVYGPDLVLSVAWLKVDDSQVLKVGTQVLAPGVDPEHDPHSRVRAVPGGDAATYSRPGMVTCSVVVGDRFIVVTLLAVVDDFAPRYSEDDLVDISMSMVGLLDEQARLTGGDSND